ncbi:hypothetical protein HDU82_004976 [Entophlyctis luteolus]|nr:hypothetical protein HDU82_004976 [Entophlyctis luteolus]
MIRPLILVIGSLHINVLQAPSLALLPLAYAFELMMSFISENASSKSNPFRQLFVAYNWLSMRLFVSLLILANWHPRNPIELIISTDVNLRLLDKCVMIANHQTQLDWMFLWFVSWRANRHSAFRIMLKDSLKSVPIFGWGMSFFSFVFLSRKWEKDEAILENRLSLIRDNSLGFYWLLIFPEGTIISPDTLKKSRIFYEKRETLEKTSGKSDCAGVLPPQRVLIPRYRALWKSLQILTLNSFRDGEVPTLLNVTIGYEPTVDVAKSVFPERVFSPKNVFLPEKRKERGPPKRVHVLVEFVEENLWLKHVQTNDEHGFDFWLKRVWREKDRAMDKFQENQRMDSRKFTELLRLEPNGWDVFLLVAAMVCVWLLLCILWQTLLNRSM